MPLIPIWGDLPEQSSPLKHPLRKSNFSQRKQLVVSHYQLVAWVKFDLRSGCFSV
nr:MAG TPA: hypothetical protein [Caudoviricetes sp.]